MLTAIAWILMTTSVIDLEMTPHRADEYNGSIYGARNRIRVSYRVPINLEWPYLDDEGYALEPTKFSFSIRRDIKLEDALNTLIGHADGKLHWVAGDSAITIKPPEAMKISILDRRIDYSVINVSPWEAIIQLGRQLNLGETEDGLHLRIGPTFWSSGYRGPLEFTDEENVTVQGKDRTVRDLLQDILQQCDCSLSYRYYIYSNPRVPSALPHHNITISALLDSSKSPELRHKVSTREELDALTDRLVDAFKRIRGEEP